VIEVFFFPLTSVSRLGFGSCAGGTAPPDVTGQLPRVRTDSKRRMRIFRSELSGFFWGQALATG
jgi:hypothetical protein